MFVRKKNNKSGIVSIQVIDKSSGAYKLVRTIGSSLDKCEIERMVLEGKQWILQQTKAIEIDFANYKEQVEQVLDGIEQLTLVGGELLLGGIFDQIGFNAMVWGIIRRIWWILRGCRQEKHQCILVFPCCVVVVLILHVMRRNK